LIQQGRSTSLLSTATVKQKDLNRILGQQNEDNFQISSKFCIQSRKTKPMTSSRENNPYFSEKRCLDFFRIFRICEIRYLQTLFFKSFSIRGQANQHMDKGFVCDYCTLKKTTGIV
jgi:hypothetical protein